MAKAIDFYFDFSSPYGFLASEQIEALAARHDRTVNWHPILLGAVFKVTGQAPLVMAPVKGDYATMDFARSAREHKIDFKMPDTFPIGSVAASRASWWLLNHEDPTIQAKSADFIHACYRAYFSEGRDITNVDVLSGIATSMGIDATAMTTACGEQSVKDLLRNQVNAAIERGVFGSPIIIVDDEMFWGHDRLEQVERWMSTGGW